MFKVSLEFMMKNSYTQKKYFWEAKLDLDFIEKLNYEKYL
jgi:hypothetical protein